MKKLERVLEKNPDLIILTDDVYGTFVKDFQTVYSVLPSNTILVYSFSKLYGVTGWRTGLIAMNRDNVCDRLLKELPREDQDYLHEEYSIVTTDPENMPFIDRIVADSRSIGLYHTSGLSTPSQVFMALMALTHLIHTDQANGVPSERSESEGSSESSENSGNSDHSEDSPDPYIQLANETVHSRYKALMEALGLPLDDKVENAQYYTLVDVLAIAEKRFGTDFAEWLRESRSEIDFLNDFARKKGVVLMYGPGFHAPEGSVRISLANLKEEDYAELAGRLHELLSEYLEEYEQQEEEMSGQGYGETTESEALDLSHEDIEDAMESEALEQAA